MAGYDITTIGDLGSAPPRKRPCCAGCADKRAQTIGDVVPEVLALHQAGFLPDVVWPSDVDAYKANLDPKYKATDAAARQCGTLAPAVLAAWVQQASSWQAFAAQSTPTFGSSNHWELAHKFETELLDWQNKLTASGCALNSPKVAPPDRGAPPDLSWLKWVAAAVVVVGVAYVASPLVMAGRKVAA